MKRPDLRTAISWAGPLLLFAILVGLRTLGDRWWPVLPLLFGPRWPLAVLALTPALAHSRGHLRRTMAATACAVACLVLLLDFRLPWRALLPPWGAAPDVIRIVEWNAQSRGPDNGRTLAALADLDAELIVIAECGGDLGDALELEPGIRVYRSAALCFITTLPVKAWEPRNPGDFWRAGGSGAIARVVVEVNGEEVVVGGVHLETPREALAELRFLSVLSFRQEALVNQDVRDVESSTARNFIRPADEQRPTIVAGDFNLVAESAIYQRWWGDMRNGFSRRGLGLGWTKRTQYFGARIDHVLASEHFQVRSATLGAAMGSDHRMLIVELRLAR